jgi:hypothetical protein
VALNVEGMRAMVVFASALGDAVRFIGLFAVVLIVGFLFPFVMMAVFRAIFLGNPTKLNTIRTYRNLPRE